MKLHRLTLTNYRGIAHREIEFPDHGVVVVCGANEIGKSSMIEALDLLLEAKDRSTKKEVKQVKPTHSDVGSEVSAEISCGPYRFVYRKRFHKKCETELTVITPYREQLTGDEAHERVRAMLAETVDSDLWHAQRVLQAASTAAVDLSGCDALSRALDVAAGDSGGLCGTEPLLIERIDAEYGRYFTPTGRPTGEWAAAIARLAEVRGRRRRGRRAGVPPRRVDRTGGRPEAQLVAEAAAATKAAAAQAHSGRLQLLADIDTRAAVVTQTLQHATEALAELERRVQEAQRTVERLAGREEADRLAARLDKIDAIQRDRERISAELSTIAVTEELLRRIEDAAAAVDRIGDQLASTSAAVEFTAVADIHLVIGDQQVSLPAGQSWSITAAGPTAVEVPGVLTARVIPGATTLDVQAKHAAAQQELAAALTAGAVADLAAARSAPDCAATSRSTSCGRGWPGCAPSMRRPNATRAVRPPPPRPPGLPKPQRRQRFCRTGWTPCGPSWTRPPVGWPPSARRSATRSRRVAELADALAAASPDAVAAELADATQESESLRERYEEAAGALREVTIELSVFGSEGRQGKLDAAETEREHAASEHSQVGRRARAAQLLRSVMTRHRDTTRQRYVEPYRAELQRLGRPVFGPTFEVDIDSDLCIRSRTLNGITVPYESLSGGAKEQLGILARLAGAALVAKEDAVPVVVDDALGFTDPDRLAKMGQLFDSVGSHGQVIVLTCSPDRYDGVKGAHRIDLSA